MVFFILYISLLVTETWVLPDGPATTHTSASQIANHTGTGDSAVNLLTLGQLTFQSNN